MADQTPNETPKLWREITIITDGNFIKITKNETAGAMEFMAILSAAINAAQKAQRSPAPELPADLPKPPAVKE